jgi:ribonuclease Z
MMVRKRYIGIVIAVLILIIAFNNRSAIMLKVFSAASISRMSENRISDLGDGLHVALCGAGGPMPSTSRTGPCVAVIADKRIFIVDISSGGPTNLGLMGLNAGDIDTVLLTHFHSDHIDGLGQLAMMRWVTGNHVSPLNVIGPQGVDLVVDGFNTAYSQDSVYRNAHHTDFVAPTSGRGMTAQSFESPGDGSKVVVFKDSGIKIEMLTVQHEPVSPSVAYLFTYQGRTAMISGDTIKNTNVEQFSKGIDLLVHEALSPIMLETMSNSAKIAGNMGASKIFFDVLDYHASPIDAAEVARDSNVGHLLYYHIVPPLDVPGLDSIWLDGVDEIFSEYTLGEDGTLFTLPPNSKEIIKVSNGI